MTQGRHVIRAQMNKMFYLDSALSLSILGRVEPVKSQLNQMWEHGRGGDDRKVCIWMCESDRRRWAQER